MEYLCSLCLCSSAFLCQECASVSPRSCCHTWAPSAHGHLTQRPSLSTTTLSARSSPCLALFVTIAVLTARNPGISVHLLVTVSSANVSPARGGVCPALFTSASRRAQRRGSVSGNCTEWLQLLDVEAVPFQGPVLRRPGPWPCPLPAASEEPRAESLRSPGLTVMPAAAWCLGQLCPCTSARPCLGSLVSALVHGGWEHQPLCELTRWFWEGLRGPRQRARFPFKESFSSFLVGIDLFQELSQSEH